MSGAPPHSSARTTTVMRRTSVVLTRPEIVALRSIVATWPPLASESGNGRTEPVGVTPCIVSASIVAGAGASLSV